MSEQVFYPSMAVNITLLFDSTLQVITDRTRFNDASEQAKLSGSQTPVTAGTSPLVLPDGENRVQILGRVPKNANVELNGTRQAGKFKLTFDFRDLPIDPRIVTNCGVEIYLGAVPEKDWADGQEKRVTSLGRSLSQVPTRNIAGGINLETLVMQGNVDNWSVTHGETGSEITLEGRDIRGLLLDLKLPPEAFDGIDLTRAIAGTKESVLDQILHLTPVTKLGLNINTVAPEAEWSSRGGIPSPGTVDGSTRVRLDAAGKKPRSTPAGATSSGGSGDRVSIWDLVTKYCALVGAVPYFYGEELWVRPARNVYETFRAIDKGTYPPPFKDAKQRAIKVADEDGNAVEKLVSVRHLVYGRDIIELSYERNYQRTAAPTIELVSIDDTKRGDAKLIVVQWPQADSNAGQLKDEGQKLRIPVPGIRDKNRLLTIAQDLYEEIGRSEQGGNASTKNLSSFGGSNADPDLLRLRPSEMVTLLTDARALSARVPQNAEAMEHKRRSFAEEELAVAWTLDGNPNGVPGKEPSSGARQIARVLTATARGAIAGDVLSYYRISNVKFDWSDSGIRVGFDFRNYITTRQQAALAGVGVASSKKKKTTVQKAPQSESLPSLANGVVTDSQNQAAPSAPANKGNDQRFTGQGKQTQQVVREKLKALGFTDVQIETMVNNYNDGYSTGLPFEIVKPR